MGKAITLYFYSLRKKTFSNVNKYLKKNLPLHLDYKPCSKDVALRRVLK